MTEREQEQGVRRALHNLNLVGFALILVLFGIGGVWASTSQLAGAVIAQGMIVVESNIKKVQHPTGGIVAEILVQEGTFVEAGQIVMRLDGTIARSTLGTMRSQLDELSVREARLLTERDDAEAIVFPDELMARQSEGNVAAALTGERKLFDSRRSGRVGQRSQLRERIGQSHEEIRGLSAQQDAKEREANLLAEELTGVTALYSKNLVTISRFMELQRNKSRLQGERGQLIADMARVRGKISETELQIIQIDRDFSTEVLKDMRETQGKIAELRERLAGAEDQLKRIDIRAPQSGVVHELAIHTVGGVIANGETIMQIVPVADSLVVEAKVAPQDIDQVTIGTLATVRIVAGNQRTMPDITGTLTRVSADLAHDAMTATQPGQPYYLIRISLAMNEVRRLGDLHLVPGMPAEAFIRTYTRTPLQYIMKPLNDQIARTFRER